MSTIPNKKDFRRLLYQNYTKKGIFKQGNVWIVSDYLNAKKCLTDTDHYSSAKFDCLLSNFNGDNKIDYIKNNLSKWILNRDYKDDATFTEKKRATASYINDDIDSIENLLEEYFNYFITRVDFTREIDLKKDFIALIIESFIKAYLNIKTNIEKYELFQNANNIAELLSTTEFSQEKIEKYYNSLIFLNSIEYNNIQCPHFKEQSALLLYAFNYNLTNLIANTILYICYDDICNISKDNITSYIDNVLKYETPLQVVLRIAIKDNILSNNIIKKGEIVSIVIGNANQNIQSLTSVLSFGHGIHKCIGEKVSVLITRKLIELLFIKHNFKIQVNDFNWENIYGFRSLKEFKVKLCKMN